MSTFQGTLNAIAIAGQAKGEMSRLEAVEAIAGHGLVGDRYAEGQGFFQRGEVKPSQEVTLIEEEALAAVARDYKLGDFELTHLTSRRNLLTANVPLNHLIGREFTIGDVVLRGVKLCEPCKYLEDLTAPGVEAALKHRGGLRAQVLEGGVVRAGDPIRPLDSANSGG